MLVERVAIASIGVVDGKFVNDACRLWFAPFLPDHAYLPDLVVGIVRAYALQCQPGCGGEVY